MTCLRSGRIYGAIALLTVLAAGRGFAAEPGDFGQYVRGVTIGVPTGAAPPPGLYFENTTLWAPSASGKGQLAGFNVDAIVDVPLIYWSTGWNFLGANVSAALAQTFFELGVRSSTAPGPPFGGATLYPAVHNTYISPLILSWNVGSGWFASAGFAFFAPDGSSYNNSPNPDYWTFEPSGSISYLGDGWDLTAHAVYEFNTSSAGHTGAFAGTPLAPFGVGYQSGDQFFLDLTATKKIGKWEIGPVAYFKWQTTDDKPGGGASCATIAAASASQLTCGRQDHHALGGLVGYDFGPVALKVFVTDSVFTRDDFQGVNIWTKLSFRLWAPETPEAPTPKRPLIHK
jgi:hypothetical protein